MSADFAFGLASARAIEPARFSATFLVDGKPHRPCACDGAASYCPRGMERALATTEFSRCLVPFDGAYFVALVLPSEAKA